MWTAAMLVLWVASPVPEGSRQALVVLAADWDANSGRAELFERTGAQSAWRAKGDGALPVSLGRAGLAWGRGLHPPMPDGPQKREGDGRSPAGVFALRGATGYTREAPVGLRLPYREATSTLRCVDDAASRHYNALVDEASAPRDWASAEDMRRADTLYRQAVWVGHNDEPVVPEAGSCIFLHLRESADAVTAGCTAFDVPAFERLLKALDPQRRPVLVQLPRAEWSRLKAAWGFGGLP